MVNLHSQVFGEGDPFVLLHGFLGSSDNWRHFAKKGQPHYQCRMIDSRNHGESGHCPTMTYKEMAQDLEDYCVKQRFGQIQALGHSMGGKTVMQWAHDCPERFESIIIVDIAPIDYPPHHRTILGALKDVSTQSYERLGDIQKKLLKAQLSNDMVLFLLKLFKKSEEGYHLKVPIDYLIAAYPDLMKAPDIHHTIHIPTHVIMGQESDYVTPQGRAAFQRCFSDVTFYSIEKANHWVHTSQPQAFDRVISEILTQS